MTSAPETTDAAWRAELDRLAADRALGPFLSGQGAVMVIAADGATVLHANAAGQALAKRGWTEQGRKRLAKLVDGLAPFAGLRLERLEFDGPDGPLTFTCACRRLRGHAQAPLLVATLQVPEALAVRPAEPREAAPEAMAAEPRAGTAADERAAEAAPPALAPAWPERLRLVWRTDAGGAITAMAPEAARLLGRDLIGARWADFIGTSVADPDGRLAAALAGETTWNALPVLWRLEQGPEAIAVQMSASPLRGPGRAFAGFGGFAIAWPHEREPWPSTEEPAASQADEAETDPPSVEAVPTSEALPAADEPPAVQTLATPDEPELPLALAPQGPLPAPSAPPTPSTVIVPLAPHLREGMTAPPLSRNERNAFREIARALGARIEGEDAPPPPLKQADRQTPREATPPEAEIAPGAAHAGSPAADADVPEAGVQDPEVTIDARAETTSPSADPLSDDLALPVEAPPAVAPAVDLATDPDAPFAVAYDVDAQREEAGGDAMTAADADATDDIDLAAVDAQLAPVEPAIADASLVEDPPAADEPVAQPTAPLAAMAEPTASTPDEAEPPSHSAEIIPLPTPTRPGQEPAFRELVDRLPIGVLILQTERVAYANRTLLDLLDYDSVADLSEAGVDQIFAVGGPDRAAGVVTLRRRDGALEQVDARLGAFQWRDQPATLVSFRRAAETVDQARLEALKLDVAKAKGHAQELGAILDTATDGVATIDERGRLLSLNRSAEALFGYDQREVVGDNFTLLLAPESHLTALDYLQGLKGDGVASLLNDGREVTGRVRQGGKIPLFMTMGRVSEGEERKYSIVLRDMTNWKQAEADLVEARKAAERASAQKSDVLAKISHEIRTPLNAIIGFTEVMSEERFGPIGNERYKEYLADIHQSGTYLISLVNDLLDLAKIEAGKMDLNFTGVGLNDVANAAVALLQPEAGRQRVVLRTGLQPRLPQVVADERSLRQIVINVLSNAVKFTDAGGQVIVSTNLGDRGEVILRVRDTGIGMSEKELAQAMEPFRQIAATRRGTGTGLGLPITRALVEANKGALTITSVKNEGTLVEIVFPPQRVLAS